MPTADDLIRKTMHDRASAVTADTLRHPMPRYQDAHHISEPRRRHAAHVLAAAASVVAVLSIAFGIYAATGGGDSHNPNTATGAADQLAGMRWILTGARSNQAITIPHDYRGELQFDSDGHFDGQNGPNAIAGTYHTSGEEITIKLGTSGTSGTSGTNPVVEAMNSFYVPSSDSTNDATSTYAVTGSTLTIETNQWTLTFDGSTEASDPPQPSGSPTNSETAQ